MLQRDADHGTHAPGGASANGIYHHQRSTLANQCGVYVGSRAQLLDSGPGEREPAERPPGGKPHGFREDGRHQSPAIGSERGTDGELAIAQRGTDQQKIGDVGACHEQQKND